MDKKITRSFDELGRIVIPKDIREEFFGTSKNDGVEMEIRIEDGKIVLIPVME
jgi:AbrB family looped-hinge helix DNA binding protein